MGFSGGITDNDAIREIRDIATQSKKQSKYMFWIALSMTFLTLFQIIILFIK